MQVFTIKCYIYFQCCLFLHSYQLNLFSSVVRILHAFSSPSILPPQICGYGHSSVYHGDNEYCTLSVMEKAFKILTTLLNKFNQQLRRNNTVALNSEKARFLFYFAAVIHVRFSSCNFWWQEQQLCGPISEHNFLQFDSLDGKVIALEALSSLLYISG